MKTSSMVLFILFFTLLVQSCASRKEAGAVSGAAVGSSIGKGSGRALAIFFGAILGSVN
jgi:outer membrane lipoprotein SlyB